MTELEEGYTAQQAAEVISKNSNRPVSADHVKKLAQLGKIRSTTISRNFKLYNKEDVKNTIVEERGTKIGRYQKEQAKKRSLEDTNPNT